MKYLRLRLDGSVHTYSESLARFSPCDEFECEPDAMPESGFIEDLQAFQASHRVDDSPRRGRIGKVRLDGDVA